MTVLKGAKGLTLKEQQPHHAYYTTLSSPNEIPFQNRHLRVDEGEEGLNVKEHPAAKLVFTIDDDSKLLDKEQPHGCYEQEARSSRRTGRRCSR